MRIIISIIACWTEKEKKENSNPQQRSKSNSDDCHSSFSVVRGVFPMIARGAARRGAAAVRSAVDPSVSQSVSQPAKPGAWP